MKPIISKKEKWSVHPEYSQENVYTLWNERGNYHRDTSMSKMDARARLMQSAPAMYHALLSIAGNTCCESCQEAKQVAMQALKDAGLI